MPNSFSIDRTRFSALSDESLREEIGYYAENDSEISSIIRSLRRFGGDVSIRYFEITPNLSRRTKHLTPEFTWSVRAVRE